VGKVRVARNDGIIEVPIRGGIQPFGIVQLKRIEFIPVIEAPEITEGLTVGRIDFNTDGRTAGRIGDL
jgi:hypothetical protein